MTRDEHLTEQFEVLKVMTTGLSEDEYKAAWMTIDHIKGILKQQPTGGWMGIDTMQVGSEGLFWVADPGNNEMQVIQGYYDEHQGFKDMSGRYPLNPVLWQPLPTGPGQPPPPQPGRGGDYLKALSDVIGKLEEFDSYNWEDYQKLQGLEVWITGETAIIKANTTTEEAE